MTVETQIYRCFVNYGAAGAATGIRTAQPSEVLHLVELSKSAANCAAAVRTKAKELEEAQMVLSTFDEGVDLVRFYICIWWF